MTEPSWELAAAEFLRPWRRRRGVVGAVVTGSRVLGTATTRSDIDVIILLGPRGGREQWASRRVHGHIVEYLAWRYARMRSWFAGDLRRGKRTRARLIGLGRIAFDRGGAVTRLRRAARASLRLPLPPIPRVAVESAKHILWDRVDTLAGLIERRLPERQSCYHLAVMDAARSYARFVRTDLPPAGRLWEFLTDPAFRRRYAIPSFPDHVFVGLLKSALRARGDQACLFALRGLTRRALVRMGGFDPACWSDAAGSPSRRVAPEVFR